MCYARQRTCLTWCTAAGSLPGCLGAQTGSGKTFTMLGPGGEASAVAHADADDVRTQFAQKRNVNTTLLLSELGT